MQNVGVSQKAIVFNEGSKFLALRRTETAPTRPNCWDLPGGDLDFGEDAVKGMIREIREEIGLQVKGVIPFDVESHINKDGDFWITIAYKAQANSDKVVLSFEHDKFQWVTPQQFLKLESSPKLRRFVKNLLVK